MPHPVTDEERARIVELLRDGYSQGGAARESKRARATVHKIAREEGIEANVQATKNATDARQRYNEAERRELLNAGFDKARAMLEQLSDAGELQKWTVAVGTLVDKVRLDSGEVTERGEYTNHNRDASAELEAYFAELDRFAEGNGPTDTAESVHTPEAYSETT